MLHLHYTSPVTVRVIREYTKRNGEQGRSLRVRVGDETFDREYSIASPLNGRCPQPGEVVGLILDAYPWEEAKVSQAGNPYIDRTTKLRVVGSFDSSKASLPKYDETPAAA